MTDCIDNNSVFINQEVVLNQQMANVEAGPLSLYQHSLVNNKYLIASTGLILASECDRDNIVAPDRDQVEYCKLWISECCRRQSAFNKHFSSDFLKVHVEEKARQEGRIETYVSTGAVIQAAKELGYKIQTLEDTPDAVFNINWKRIQPTGFSKWLFQQEKIDDMIGDLAKEAISDPTWPRKAKRFVDFYLYLDETHRACKECLDALKDGWIQCFRENPPYVSEEVKSKCDRFYQDDCDVISYKGSYQFAPEGKTYIYVLFEQYSFIHPSGFPLDRLRVRYVGQSVNPAKRLMQHVLCPGSEKRVIWIADKLKKHEYPRMAIVDLVDKSDATYAETVFIMAFGDIESEGREITEVLLNEYLTY